MYPMQQCHKQHTGHLACEFADFRLSDSISFFFITALCKRAPEPMLSKHTKYADFRQQAPLGHPSVLAIAKADQDQFHLIQM